MNALHPKILSVTASPGKERSLSLRIGREVLARLTKNSDASVIELDLSEGVIPYWGSAEVNASFKSPLARTDEERALLQKSDELCAELLQADTLVISTPMWNFSIPSQLKAWIDHIVRAGVTFQYGPRGPEGLLTGLKKVYVIESCGGDYSSPEAASVNHVGPYLRDIFRFLGAAEVSIISLNGTAIDPEKALSEARRQVDREFSLHEA